LELKIPNLHKYLQIIIIFFNCYYHYCAVMNIWSKNHSLFLAEHFVISTCSMYLHRKSRFWYSTIEMWVANIFNNICYAWCLCFYATHNKIFMVFLSFFVLWKLTMDFVKILIVLKKAFRPRIEFEKNLTKQNPYWAYSRNSLFLFTIFSCFRHELNNKNFIGITNKTQCRIINKICWHVYFRTWNDVQKFFDDATWLMDVTVEKPFLSIILYIFRYFLKKV